LKYIPIAFLLLTTTVGAQSQQQQSPAEQALGIKLMQEINAGLQCAQQSITLQQQLAAITKERDELKTKMTPEDHK
jgi:hypothetical protein